MASVVLFVLIVLCFLWNTSLSICLHPASPSLLSCLWSQVMTVDFCSKSESSFSDLLQSQRTSCYKWYWQKGASAKLEKTEILWLVAHDSWFGANMRNDAENPLHTFMSLTKWHLFTVLHVLVLVLKHVCYLIVSHQPQLEVKNNIDN